ncbi:Alternative NAD(P)H-ubiquinone oxidoreductase C1 [Hibiscus syriacus]|uniref:Alternative NAD(P)H-ubiquinone oxidoreductase C1 n=1 Tax=Hibiscus syriacus TaxID=106335 RepID=A0A6A2Y8E7_HIBSY|nr:Alternative NAD(P)H-ubiquinone oxidoreductase C1 [Hibiscus syriacus]
MRRTCSTLARFITYGVESATPHSRDQPFQWRVHNEKNSSEEGEEVHNEKNFFNFSLFPSHKELEHHRLLLVHHIRSWINIIISPVPHIRSCISITLAQSSQKEVDQHFQLRVHNEKNSSDEGEEVHNEKNLFNLGDSITEERVHRQREWPPLSGGRREREILSRLGNFGCWWPALGVGFTSLGVVEKEWERRITGEVGHRPGGRRVGAGVRRPKGSVEALESFCLVHVNGGGKYYVWSNRIPGPPYFSVSCILVTIRVLSSRKVQLLLGYFVRCIQRVNDMEASEDATVKREGKDIADSNSQKYVLDLQPAEKGLESEILEADFGQAETDETLRVKGHPRIFALGDSSSLRDSAGSLLPATAQQADFAGWNPWASINNSPLLPFRFQNLGEMMTLGRNDAAISPSFVDDMVHCARKLAYMIRLPTDENRVKGKPGVTGAVMWDSGVVLGKFIEHAVDLGMLVLQSKKVVELGALLGAQVILTDLADRLRLLKKNAETNLRHGVWGSAAVKELTWGDDPDNDLIETPPDYGTKIRLFFPVECYKRALLGTKGTCLIKITLPEGVKGALFDMSCICAPRHLPESVMSRSVLRHAYTLRLSVEQQKHFRFQLRVRTTFLVPGSDVIYSEGAVVDLLDTLILLCGQRTTVFLSGELRNEAAVKDFVVGRVDQSQWHPDYRTPRAVMYTSFKSTHPGTPKRAEEATMQANGFDGNAAFSGGGFMPSQATQSVPARPSTSSSSKNSDTRCLIPLTVKQLNDLSRGGESDISIDGVDVNNILLVGMVSKIDNAVSDCTFRIDDGTGWVECTKWIHERVDSAEVDVIS